MGSKYTVKEKQLTKLGIKKTESGDYEYIDPSEKNKSKYQSIKLYDKH
jgi:hypothetical protein